jgi:hypothetical protein
MVSPKPLSVFVPDVTLIAFPIPVAADPHGGRAFSSRESLSLRVKKMVLILILRANSGANPNSPWFEAPAGRFRRLFEAAQSTAASKLANPLI